MKNILNILKAQRRKSTLYIIDSKYFFFFTNWQQASVKGQPIQKCISHNDLKTP